MRENIQKKKFAIKKGALGNLNVWLFEIGSAGIDHISLEKLRNFK